VLLGLHPLRGRAHHSSIGTSVVISRKLLSTNAERFRGGLAFKAHLVESLNSTLEGNCEEEETSVVFNQSRAEHFLRLLIRNPKLPIASNIS
jgi:hypothetical protein